MSDYNLPSLLISLLSRKEMKFMLLSFLFCILHFLFFPKKKRFWIVNDLPTKAQSRENGEKLKLR